MMNLRANIKCKVAKAFGLLSILTLCYLWQGCGLIDDQSPDGEMANLDNFETVCPVDTEVLRQILDRDVTKEIDCLEKNLDKFAKFVRRQDQNVIKQDELETFILRFMNIEPKFIKDFLYIIFQVNSLILRDSPDTLHVNNIKPFMDLIRAANIHGSGLKHIFIKIRANGYWNHRNEMMSSLSGLADKINNIIEGRPNNNHFINTIPFLENVKEAAQIPDENFNLDMVKSLLFFKRLFIGGERNVLTAVEVEGLIRKVPEIIKSYYDFVEVKRHHFDTDWEYYRYLLSNAHGLKSMLMEGHKTEVILDHDELLDLFQRFLTEYNWKNVGDSLKLFKKDIIGGDSHYYTLEDVRVILGFGQGALESLFFYTHAWDLLSDELERDKVITSLPFPESDEFKIISTPRLIELWDDFMTVTSKYRLFPEENGLTLFSYQYRRTKWGYLLQSIFRYGGNKLFQTYRTSRTSDGRWSIDKENIRKVIVGYKGALEEFKMWPQDLDRLVRELMLGSDVFQYVSNGDGLLQMIEVVSYLPTIIGANKMGSEIFEGLRKYCETDDLFNFEVTCYRENFFPTLFFDMNKKEYFPNFYQYFKNAEWSVTQQFLKDAEGMARIDPDPKVPVTKTDLSRMLTSMSNGEGLFLRYDKNKNHLLDRDELEDVFVVLKKVLAEEANLKPTSKLLKSVFLYIIKKKKHPSVVQLLLFHVFGKKKNIYADRNTVAAVLKMFAPKNDDELMPDYGSIEDQVEDLSSDQKPLSMRIGLKGER
ncbi:MAG: hypothetical protein KC493_10530 [Bacteriovoracaceae bacterium]|nr:hypothetical protein [Bacteriovoracaceae bacterium]